MSSRDDERLAAVRLHPAYIVIGGWISAVVGSELWPIGADMAHGGGARAVGLGLIVLGIVTLVLAYAQLRHARTTIDPRQRTTALVTSGIYRMSRNPVYLGWLLLTAGVGVARGTAFPLAVAGLMLVLLHWAVVVKEEEYLQRVFGEEYRRYRGAVRRWF